MNDSVKFPNTLDASVWASRCTAWFGAFKVPDLTEWFQAALSFAYVRGSEETLEKQKLAERPNPVAPLDSFDARNWAKEFMRCASGYAPGTEGYRIMEETAAGWFANALMRGYDEHRWKVDEEVRFLGNPARPGCITLSPSFPPDRFRSLERRVEEIAAWLGTRQHAPERDFARQTWLKIEELEASRRKFEAEIGGLQAEQERLAFKVEELERVSDEAVVPLFARVKKLEDKR